MESPSEGDRRAGPPAIDELYSLAYDELRRLAGAVKHGDPFATVTTTALVNEAWLKLAASPHFRIVDERHFKHIVVRAMRQVLVDSARARQADKRGNGVRPEPLESALDVASADGSELLALDEALTQLEALDAQAARIVELRYFAGLSLEESAAALGLHPSSAYREWQHARAWLRRRLAP